MREFFFETLVRYREKGLGGRLGFGERPAVLMIDFCRGFTDPSSPLGADLTAQVEAANEVIRAARSKGRPVIFTTIAYVDPFQEAGLWIRKIPALEILRRGSPWGELDSRLDRESGDLVLVKSYASAFFGTPLASVLGHQQVDTLLIGGCTTSGCVRASVVDAIQYGFRPLVVREAVGDRAEVAHQANLLDIEGKYGDVISLAEALNYLASVK